MTRSTPFGTLFAVPLKNGVSYASKVRGRGTQMINMREIFAYDRISNEPCERAPLTDRESAAYQLEELDLLFARQSLTYEGAGKCSIFLGADEARTWESHLMRVRLDREVAWPAFYYYYFRSHQGRRSVESIVQQVAAAGIRGSDLARLVVPHPSMEVQRGIAEVLGALDDKIAANSALAQSADSLAEAIFAQTCAAQDVSAAPLGFQATMVLGGTPSRANEEYWRDGCVPWLNSGKANEQRVIIPSELITEEALANSAAKMMPIGATVLAITGATLGQLARLEIEACGNQSLVGIWGPSDAETDWIHFAVRAAIPELLKSATGAAQQHVNKQAVARLPIVTASDDTIAGFGAAVRPLLSRAAQADRESLFLSQTRDALLPQLMSGKIRVKDAERVVEEVV